MLPSAGKLAEWKGFPKGLQVMVVDEDKEDLDDAKMKLESCGYVVTAFTNEHEALAALQDRNRCFHVAVVQATSSDMLDGFKILEATKHLVTIMMSDTDNLTTVMRGIAAGASEFLQKPLSREKLKNIWQHVVRKALSTGELLPNQLAPTTDTAPFFFGNDGTGSGLMSPQLVSVKEEPPEHTKIDTPLIDEVQEAELFFSDHEAHLSDAKPDLECDSFSRSARFPGPSTPQLEQASRVSAEAEDPPYGSPFSHDFTSTKSEVDDDTRDNFEESDNCLRIKTESEDCIDEPANSNGFLAKKNVLHREEYDNLDSMLYSDLHFEDNEELQGSFEDIALSNDLVDLPGMNTDPRVLEEFTEQKSPGQLRVDCGGQQLAADVSEAEEGMISGNDTEAVNTNAEVQEQKAKTRNLEHNGNKGSSNSSQGKKKTKVDWTPELHRRFVQAVEQLGVDKAIPSRILELMAVQHLSRHNVASHLQKYRSHKKHLMAREAEAACWNRRRQLPGRERNPAWVVSRPPQVAAPPLHVWGVAAPYWHPPLNSWSLAAPAPGTPLYPQPVLRLPLAPIPNMAFPVAPVENPVDFDGKMANFHPPQETVDAAINEVLRNPFIPLPLGLKPPSLESVVAELQRQGITTLPPAFS